MRRLLVCLALTCVPLGSLVAETAHLFVIVQKGRTFSVPDIVISKGDTLRFKNEDGFLHQIFIHSDTFTIDSDEQKPGQDLDIQFPVGGKFNVLCAIHPKMDLTVEVR